MKVLIWVLTFIIGSIVNTLIGYAIGIRAGAVLLYVVEYFIAKKLCEKWDQNHSETQPTDSGQKSDVVATPVAVDDVPAETDSIPVAPANSTGRKILYCKRCGYKLIEGSDFCSKCGTQIDTGDTI